MRKLQTALVVLFALRCGGVMIADSFGESRDERRRDALRRDFIFAASIWWLGTEGGLVEPHECRSWSGERNPVYFTSAYAPTWAEDRKSYNILIMGDSTMDGACRSVSGFASSMSACRPVSGNTLCDMREQFPAVTRAAANGEPSALLWATTGGNDALRGFADDRIWASAEALIDRARERFPGALIAMVGVHPTRIESANARRKRLNDGVAARLEARSPAGRWCFVDPLPLFSVAEGQPANTSDMLDDIHYNANIATALKGLIESQCGVRL